MSFAQKINQLFRRKPIAAAVSGDSGMMGDTVVQDMYDGSLNSVQGHLPSSASRRPVARTNW